MDFDKLQQHPRCSVVKDRAKERWDDAVAFALEQPEYRNAEHLASWPHHDFQARCQKQCDQCTPDGDCPRYDRVYNAVLDLVESYIDRIYVIAWNNETGACRVTRMQSRTEAEQWWSRMQDIREICKVECAVIYYGFDKPDVLAALPPFVAMALQMDVRGRALTRFEQIDMIVASGKRDDAPLLPAGILMTLARNRQEFTN